MKRTGQFFILFFAIPLMILTGCKKDSDPSYTYTIVPLTILGFTNAPTAILDQPFVRQFPAMGGKPPYTWTLVEGSLPPGLSLDPRGRVYGTPSTSGEYTYKLKLTDSKGAQVTSSYTQTISVSGSTVFLLGTPQIPEYGQDQNTGYLFFAQGGALPWTFTITGLPDGLSYDPETGLISGTPTEPFTGSIVISLRDANGNEASGSPVTATFSVNAPEPTGGGGGGHTNCIYEGTYIGQFTYVYYQQGQNGDYSPVTAGFQLSVKMEHLATAEGISVMTITHVTCSDANFGCQVGGCTPNYGSVANLPADPPANSSNPSQPGMGIVIFFPNGATLATANAEGNLNVSSDGRTLSNSLDPGIQDATWIAIAGDFGTSVPPGGPSTEFKSWSMSWSSTLKESYQPLLSTTSDQHCLDCCYP
ncbi:MAG TPA: Ig domain-containing protein [Bacteroidales bacterium]|nr:Ig domain-containing protein [Bacteroidales bacterium]HPS73082.1 Ig domain-containing protein [Bacteroidales bacterium]